MLKNEFLKFLKNLSTALDKAEIVHEIPYVHIDKEDFNHIIIIIPDIVSEQELSAAYNFEYLSVKKDIIFSKIDGFDVFFIKTNAFDIGYSMYYYSWNILPTLINCLCYGLNMKYNQYGLKYMFQEKEIFLSKNMEKIFEIIDLNFKMFAGGGFVNTKIFNHFIQNSKFFNSEYFNHDLFKEFDPFYEWNIKYYDDFIEYMGFCDQEYDLDELIEMIDLTFTDVRFFEKLSEIQVKLDMPGVKFTKKPFVPKNFEISDLRRQKEEQLKKKKINLNDMFKKNKEDNDFKTWE